MSYTTFASGGHFDAALTSMSQPLCIVAWVKKSAAQWAAGAADYAWIFAYDMTSNDNQLRMYTGADRAVTIRTTTSEQSSSMIFTDGDYDDIWVPIFQNYESPTVMYTYVEDSTNKGNNNTGSRDLTALDEFRIGKFTDLGSAPFEGKIAEISIWDAALDESEIDLFNPTAETGPVAPDIDTSTSGATCVAYYPFDNDADTQVDESGQANGSLVVDTTRDFDSDHPTITSSSALLLRRRR